jgi:hypothetical protein
LLSVKAKERIFGRKRAEVIATDGNIATA